jgi:sulfide:quinone oxidoreductase
MLHDYMVKLGVRRDCEIDVVLPQPAPVPPSSETSRALVEAFNECGIKFHPNKRVASIDATRKIATLDDGVEMDFDVFFGVPKHRAPSGVIESGLTEDGWVTVNPRTLEAKFANVYAVGDNANTGTPKAGVFAEGAAKAVATTLIAKIRNLSQAVENSGSGTCYIEFGGGLVGKVEVDFFSGPKPIGTYYEPSAAIRADK